MNILAVDDEKIALEGLESAIRKADPTAQIYSFRKPSETLEFCQNGDKHCEAAFLDIQMRGMNGVELAKQVKLLSPKTNLIFATGYGEYRGDAFDIHASGYLMKPITPEKVRKELEDLRHPVCQSGKNRVRFQTFGNFEVFIDGAAVPFKYEKTKEMLAYLVDRRGALCTSGEIMAVLWQDGDHSAYFRSLKKDLLDTIKEAGCMDIFLQQWGKLGIAVEKVDCDYYDWQKGELYALNLYRGEYMCQYTWGEITNAGISMEQNGE